MSVLIGCLWFIPIAFMFYCQHHVCEEYFIPAINVLVSTANSSPNKWLQRWGDSAVAGATVMALGCNGPELFCNLISLYIGSDAGIGVVVGSEIFNLLIIIGCSVLFCPTMPLVLEQASFVRDCFFYALSIVLLVWALMIRTPNYVEPVEAGVLLIAEVVFVVAVYFTQDVVGMFSKKPEGPVVAVEAPPSTANAAIHGISVKVKQEYCGRMAAKGGTSEDWNLDPTAAGIYTVPPVEAAKKDQPAKKNARASVGFAFQKEGSLMESAMMMYKDLVEVRVVAEGVFYMDFVVNSIESVSLRVEVPGGIDERNQLLENIKKYSLGKAWVHEYNPGFSGAIEHFKHAMSGGGTWDTKVLATVEFICDCMLKPTLSAVDVKDIQKESRWPLCFLGAMGWLAVFSFLMLEVATQINSQIPQLSMAFLGVTVCAVGTSFPNAIASILMSKQDKSAAAIANALGSNVQNVFLAMALPWIIFMATPTSWTYVICVTPREQWSWVAQEPPTKGQSVVEGVEWMCGTLILVIVMAIMPQSCTFSKPYGVFLCFVYVVYLVWTSYEALAPSPAPVAAATAHAAPAFFL